MMSAADMLDVGWPDPALVLARIPSTRICWATWPTKSSAGSAPASTLPDTAMNAPPIGFLNLNDAAKDRWRAVRCCFQPHGVQSRVWPCAYSSARIERLTTDQKAGGSNPPGRTKPFLLVGGDGVPRSGLSCPYEG